MSTSADAAYRVLFDNLRALANERPIRALVFASTSVEESPRPVITGLAAEATRLGRRVVIAVLTESAGRSLLQRRPSESDQGRPSESDQGTGAGDALSLDLSRPDWQAAFEDWLCHAAAGADLIIVEGRPLEQSIDAALIARACDGLVLVARTEVTPRHTLQAAAERARAVGCRTLGVVMHGTKNHLPAWLRELGR
jgi:Mrp family chromosome partitioning ATPase